jgi:hypothetical protein
VGAAGGGVADMGFDQSPKSDGGEFVPEPAFDSDEEIPF